MQPMNDEPGNPARAYRGRLGWVVPTLCGLVLTTGLALCVTTAALVARAPGTGAQASVSSAGACSGCTAPGATAAARCATSTPIPTPTSDPSATATPAGGSHDVVRSFTILQGQTVTNAVTVPAGSPSLVVSVNWQTGTVSTTLLSPGGRLITAATQASDVTLDGDPTWQYYLVSFPETGVWTFESTGISVEPGGEKANINAEAIPQIPPMVLAFASPTAGGAPLTVTFTASASDLEGGAITSYAWQFGDGTSGMGASTTHTYAGCGTYVATVTATSSEGLQGSSTTDQIVVKAEKSP
jgi:hypothetical protein